jgi:hypothetical protein
MKKFYLLFALAACCLHLPAQVNGIQIRAGWDMWKLGYTASSLQINCGLCPYIIEQQPGAELAIAQLRDSINVEKYMHGGLTLAIGASFLSPALRGELQISPSMRRLNTESERVNRYANRNISLILGFNPLQLSEYAGRFYLGSNQRFYLDVSDAGAYVQLSYDGGFEEFVRSTNNVAVMARFQPTVWLSDQQRFGVSIRSGMRMWMLGNGKADGPFLNSSGIPRRVKPDPDWFLGIALILAPFGATANSR